MAKSESDGFRRVWSGPGRTEIVRCVASSGLAEYRAFRGGIFLDSFPSGAEAAAHLGWREAPKEDSEKPSAVRNARTRRIERLKRAERPGPVLVLIAPVAEIPFADLAARRKLRPRAKRPDSAQRSARLAIARAVLAEGMRGKVAVRAVQERAGGIHAQVARKLLRSLGHELRSGRSAA